MDTQELLLAGLGSGLGAAVTKEAGASRTRLAFLQKVQDELSATQAGREIFDALTRKEKRARDKQLYVISEDMGTSTSLKMWKSDQAKSEGLANITNVKHDKWFLCTGIRLLYHAGPTKLGTRFDAEYTAAVANGEFSLRIDNKEIIKDLPVDAFANVAQGAVAPTIPQDCELGEYKLDNPFWIAPDKVIEMELRLGAAGSGNNFFKTILKGIEIE